MKKSELISEIKKTIKQYGWLTSKDLDWDSDIIFNSIGGDHYQLIDTLTDDCVSVTEYIHEEVQGTLNFDYADLSKDFLMEIYHRLQQAEMEEGGIFQLKQRNEIV